MATSPTDFITRTAEKIVKQLKEADGNKLATDMAVEVLTLQLRLAYYQGFKEALSK